MPQSRGDMKSTIHHEYLQPGDVVVGQYSDHGHNYKQSVLTGDNAELAYKMSMIADDAKRTAGVEVIKPKIGKPIKAKKRNVKQLSGEPPVLNAYTTRQEVEAEVKTTYSRPDWTTEKPIKHTVFLHNKLGKIKMSVEAVLTSEMAYCLVFNSEDDMIFVPNAGETLTFIDINGESTEVYYADTQFSWIDKVKHLMVLFKSNE